MEVQLMLKFFTKSITIIFVLTYVSLAHAGDAEKGKKVFNKCKACHGIDEGGKNKLGPNLWNIVGAPIAAKEGYKYSKALIAYAGEAGNWNEDNLDAWLKKPKDLVRKSKMIFPGLKKDADRANIIAFLKANGK
jgi:cytochrome c